MALQVRPLPFAPRLWARKALNKHGSSVLQVVRVFPPADTGDTVECIYVDERERPRTAWIAPDGKVAMDRSGW